MSGKAFSPGAAEQRTGLILSNHVEPGAMTARGRYRNTPSPEGTADLRPSNEGGGYDGVEELLDLLGKHQAGLLACGVEDFQLYIAVAYDQQCNLEFSPDLLTKFSQLKLPLLISVYNDDSGQK